MSTIEILQFTASAISYNSDIKVRCDDDGKSECFVGEGGTSQRNSGPSGHNA